MVLYDSLDPDSHHIRLLEIDTGGLSWIRRQSYGFLSRPSAQCTLRTVSLRDKPVYKALSYTWGSRLNLRTISVNGHSINITDNLNNLLVKIARDARRKEERNLLFWIDAICINQSDNEEKGHQIELMRHIYAQAAEVVIWIGKGLKKRRGITFPRQDMALDAFQALQNWAEAEGGCNEHDPHPNNMGIKASLQKESSAHKTNLSLDKINLENIKATPKLWKSKDREALKALLNEQYWSRVWIIQEIVSAANARLIWGENSMDVRVLIRAITLISSVANSTSDGFQPEGLGVLRQISRSSKFLDLQTLGSMWLAKQLIETDLSAEKILERFSPSFLATDDRDKVYALLGLSPCHTLLMKADYSLSTAQVYSRVFRSIVLETKSLRLLRLAGIGQKRDKLLSGLPSWSPDFRHSLITSRDITNDHFLSSNRFTATGDNLCDVEFSEHLQFLTSKSIIVDIITEKLFCKGLDISDDNHGDSGMNNICSSLRQLRLFALDGDKTFQLHPTGIPIPQALIRTLMIDDSGYGGGSPHFVSQEEETDFFLRALQLMLLFGAPKRGNSPYASVLVREDEKIFTDSIPAGISFLTSIAISELIGRVQDGDVALSSEMYDEIFLGKKDSSRRLQWPSRFLEHFQNAFQTATWDNITVWSASLTNSSFFKTSKGYMGIIKGEVQVGDQICLLLGCPVPLVIRKQEKRFLIIGQCYVYGMMKGEMMKKFKSGELEVDYLIFE